MTATRLNMSSFVAHPSVGFYNGQKYGDFQTLFVSPYGLYDMAGNVWQ